MADPGKQGAPRPDFMARMHADLALAGKVKAALQRKQKRIGWTKCPHCGERITAVMVGARDHIHMACKTPGCVRVME